IEETWFPGYPWVVLHCSSCLNHLGWRWENPGRIPPLFYGLIRERLVEKKLIHLPFGTASWFISYLKIIKNSLVFCFVDSTPKKFK
ncbi:MAG: hypothetical protein VXZ12_09835, partial [SAR324 cluster bacterium]|nr:hypothetical protein [SAR324 cluster bacterium]